MKRLPPEQFLYLRGVDITDLGMAKIAQMQNIRELNLSHGRFGDKGLAMLKAMPHLERLQLVRTRTTDSAMASAGWR